MQQYDSSMKFKYLFQILDCLQRFDKSHEPVTSFPSKIETTPDIPVDTQNEEFGLPVAAGYSPGRNDMTIPVQDDPISDLSTWDESAPSSPLHTGEPNLVKSKVDR